MVAITLDRCESSLFTTMQGKNISLKRGFIPASGTFSFFFCSIRIIAERTQRTGREFKKRGKMKISQQQKETEEWREEAAKRPLHLNPFHKRRGDKKEEASEASKE